VALGPPPRPPLILRQGFSAADLSDGKRVAPLPACVTSRSPPVGNVLWVRLVFRGSGTETKSGVSEGFVSSCAEGGRESG
jgi:hypothetical protein